MTDEDMDNFSEEEDIESFNDEDEELTDDTPDLSPSPDMGFGTSDMRQQSYENEMFKFLSEIIRSPWKDDIVAHIKTLPLTLQYKEVLLSTITELLSITKVLANNDKMILTKFTYVDPMPSKLLDAELRLLMTQTCAEADDLEILNAWIMESNVLAQHRDYISRTVGGRERERNNLFIKNQMINSQEDITRTPVPEPQKKSGLARLLGR